MSMAKWRLSLTTLKECLNFQESNDERRREGFFRPHTVPILAFYLTSTFIIALIRNNTSPDQNTSTGHLALIIFILIIGVQVLPDGPLTRPHPVFWRMVSTFSLIYLMTLIYILFQNLETLKSIIYWFYPKLESVTDVFQTPYDMNCTDYSKENIFSKTDVYTFGHFFGWMAKAMLVRHYGMCWLFSITWEVTELAFDHLLPFAECWWDSIVLDVIVTNGLGIWAGMMLLKLFRIETFEWEGSSQEQISYTENREALIRLSSEARDVVESFDHFDTYVRVLALWLFNTMWQITELNTFFQMQIFDIPAEHPLAVGRLILIGLLVASVVPDYLTYVKQSEITKFSANLWIFVTIIIMEVSVNIKYEPKIMTNVRIGNVLLWLIIELFFCIVCTALCLYWSKFRSRSIEPDTCVEKV